ncbi:hypothetical protein [Egbenema bharatensis]|uniref:hypothetical protein n=1 Tax=Egbenema bharatensis TaxID=3463334 RepID=UPI003A8B7327
MAQSPLLKNFPASWQSFLRPMLLLSLGLHALVLLVPLPSNQPSEIEEVPEEESISLTQIPSQAQTVEASPSPTPAVAPPPSPPPPSPIAPLAPAIAPPTTPPLAIAPQPAPEAASAEIPDPSPNPPAPDPFAADFPRYPNAQPGSFGLPQDFEPFSFRTPDALSTVDRWFEEQLSAQQFLAQPIEEFSETGRSVYRVSRGDAVKYLTLIPNAEGAGTSYLLSDQPLPEDLGSRRVVSVEEVQFYGDLADIIPNPSGEAESPWQEIDPNRLPDPNAFYSNLAEIDLLQGDIAEWRSGIQRAVLAARQNNPQALFSERFQTPLEIADYTITPQGQYGGGELYQISRDGVTGYISLVPTTDNVATAIFIWNRTPN